MGYCVKDLVIQSNKNINREKKSKRVNELMYAEEGG